MVAANGGTFGACGTNACHNSGTSITTGTPAVTAYSWNTTQTDCVTCHLEAGLASNAHNEHLRFAGAAGDCVECHAGATAATHINASVNFAAANVDYSRGAAVAIGGTASGTCGTSTCHNRPLATATESASGTRPGCWIARPATTSTPTRRARGTRGTSTR